MRLSFFSAQQIVSLVVLTLLLAASLLWVWHIVGMQKDGTMESCVLAGGRIMLCALSAAAQIGLWQEMFVTVLPLAAAVLFATAILLRLRRGTARESDLESSSSALPAWFIRRFLHWLPREPLRESFSQGLLHPKIYAS